MAFIVSPKRPRDKVAEARILPRELATELLREKGNHPGSRWQSRIWIALSAYRFLAFAIAAVVIFAFPFTFHSVLPPLILVICIGIYSVLKVLQPPRWYQSDILSLSLLGIDIVVCILLIMSTGGFYSPFLLYTLAPVLTAAVFLDSKVTSSIAGVSVAYVIGSHLNNPLSPAQPSYTEISYFSVYLAAVSLAAVLP